MFVFTLMGVSLANLGAWFQYPAHPTPDPARSLPLSVTPHDWQLLLIPLQIRRKWFALWPMTQIDPNLRRIPRVSAAVIELTRFCGYQALNGDISQLEICDKKFKTLKLEFWNIIERWMTKTVSKHRQKKQVCKNWRKENIQSFIRLSSST